MKVSFFNSKLLKSYGYIISGISTVVSLVIIFIDIPNDRRTKGLIATVFLVFLCLLYVALWIYSNRKKKANLKINGTKITIRVGDIFKEPGLKIIPFNEYFDTKVDDKIISSQTLNGKYILGHLEQDIEYLDSGIANDEMLKEKIRIINTDRKNGKTIKYTLGSIFKNGEYLLLAFSEFDKDNRAYLNKNSYWNCLMNMWNEIDIVHAGYSINIPLLGTGITRFHGMNLDGQELLELLIISFKISGLKLNWNAKINIIIYTSDADKINFYKLSDLSE